MANQIARSNAHLHDDETLREHLLPPTEIFCVQFLSLYTAESAPSEPCSFSSVNHSMLVFDIWRTKSCASSRATVTVAVISAVMLSNPAATLLYLRDFTLPMFVRCMKCHAIVHVSLSGKAAAYIDDDIDVVEKCDRQPRHMRRTAYTTLHVTFYLASRALLLLVRVLTSETIQRISYDCYF